MIADKSYIIQEKQAKRERADNVSFFRAYKRRIDLSAAQVKHYI